MGNLRIGMCVACLALAACLDTGMTPGPSLPDPASDTCDATPYGGLIGQDATVLERVLILRQVRVIRPETAVTMDFRPERLNFQIGSTGKIERISCG